MSQVKISITVRVNTDRFNEEELEGLSADCTNAGFPITSENLAWFAAEQIAAEANYMFGMAVSAEVSG